MSSIGADLPEGTGPITGLHAQEERLRTLPGINTLILRPALPFSCWKLPATSRTSSINARSLATSSKKQVAAPVVLSYGRFDLSYSAYGLLLMADKTPAWREVYTRIADELAGRYPTYWGSFPVG